MAIIVRQQLPPEDLEGIASFMRSGGVNDLPELSRRGAAVLEVVTSGELVGLGRVVVGRFVLHKEVDPNTRQIIRETEENVASKHSDFLDQEGSTQLWGVVVEDYEAPEDAFLIDVPV